MAPDPAIGLAATMVAVAVGATVGDAVGPPDTTGPADVEAAGVGPGLPDATGVGAGVEPQAATSSGIATRSRARPADRAPDAIDERYARPGPVGSPWVPSLTIPSPGGWVTGGTIGR